MPRLAGFARQEARELDSPDHDAMFDAVLGLLTTDDEGRPDWSTAPRYVLDHLLDHAPDPDFSRRLLSDPGFLVNGSAIAISAALEDRRIPTSASLRTAWYAVAPALATGPSDPVDRAALLHAGALATAPRLAEAVAPLAEQAVCTARWSRPRLSLPTSGGPPNQWPGAVRALAIAAAGGTPGYTLVAVDPLGQVRWLDPASGACSRWVEDVPVSGARGVAALPSGGLVLLEDGGPLLPAGAVDGALTRVLMSYSAARLGGSADGEGREVLAVGGDVTGGLLVFGDASGTAHLHGGPGGWDDHRSAVLAEVPLTAVCCLASGDGQSVVAAGTAAGDIVLWAASRSPLEVPLTHRDALPRSIAITVTPSGPVVAVSWSGDVVDVLMPGGEPYALHLPHDVEAVAFAPDGLLVAGGWSGTSAWRADARRLA